MRILFLLTLILSLPVVGQELTDEQLEEIREALQPEELLSQECPASMPETDRNKCIAEWRKLNQRSLSNSDNVGTRIPGSRMSHAKALAFGIWILGMSAYGLFWVYGRFKRGL
jgi:hypothetical protein